MSFKDNLSDFFSAVDATFLKPIIYLYPTKTTDIKVTLGHPELITTSYPKYANGWQVTAKPSGDLVDRKTGHKLYSLYWEGKNADASVKSDGFETPINVTEQKLSPQTRKGYTAVEWGGAEIK